MPRQEMRTRQGSGAPQNVSDPYTHRDGIRTSGVGLGDASASTNGWTLEDPALPTARSVTAGFFLHIQGHAAPFSWSVQKDLKTLAHGQPSPGLENTAPPTPVPLALQGSAQVTFRPSPAPAWHHRRPSQALIIANPPSKSICGGFWKGSYRVEGVPTVDWHLPLTAPWGILRTNMDRERPGCSPGTSCPPTPRPLINSLSAARILWEEGPPHLGHREWVSPTKTLTQRVLCQPVQHGLGLVCPHSCLPRRSPLPGLLPSLLSPRAWLALGSGPLSLPSPPPPPLPQPRAPRAAEISVTWPSHSLPVLSCWP